MRRAEKIYRKIKCCQIPFSLEAAIWIRRVQVYNSILLYHKGKINNHGNLKRAARQCNITDPLLMPIKVTVLCLEACKKECIFYQEHGKRFQRKHLEERKRAAQENNDKEAFANISAIIRQEHQQDFWRQLNYVTGKKKTQSATNIQVECQGGAIVERTTQDTVEQTIFSEIHDKRYTQAGEAPICNGDLFRNFGYLVNTPASRAVLDGTYKMPTTSDTATAKLFCRNCCYLRSHPKGLGVNHHHAKPMEKELASSEQRDLLLRVGAPFWSLQGGQDVRYHSTLPRGTSDRYLGACDPVRKMGTRSLCDAGKNSRGNIGFKIKGNTADGGRLQCN